jgi:hypothetical protein
MAKIDLSTDILKHTDEEIIEFLYDEMRDIRLAFHGALEQNDPSLAYTAYAEVELVVDVLRRLNRRNEEKAL